jgi:ankyrin repeat protein
MIASSPQAQSLVARRSQPSAVATVASTIVPEHTSQVRGDITPRNVLALNRQEPTQAGLAVRAGIANDYRDMMTAVMLSDKAAVNDFLERGVDINERQKGITYLIAAVNNGDIEMVKLLISRGADVNRTDHRGVLPLLYARTSWPQDISLSRILEHAGAQNPYASNTNQMRFQNSGSAPIAFESY